MYPGKGTVVLIRPAQTFYERIIFRDALQLLKRKGAMVLVVQTSKVDSLNAMVNTAGVASEVVRGEGHSIIRATAGS